jgi:hypothetical protein
MTASRQAADEPAIVLDLNRVGAVAAQLSQQRARLPLATRLDSDESGRGHGNRVPPYFCALFAVRTVTLARSRTSLTIVDRSKVERFGRAGHYFFVQARYRAI